MHNCFHQHEELWQVNLESPQKALAAIESALEDGMVSISTFEQDLSKDIWNAIIIYHIKPDHEQIKQAIERVKIFCDVSDISFEISKIENNDWVSITQNNFPPLEIGDIVILGSHHSNDLMLKVKYHNKTIIYMDAGAAFGTGEHETTTGCIEALQWVMQKQEFSNKINYGLDMGAGSAILAIAAAKKYNIKMDALDIDEVSVKVASWNISNNDTQKHVRTYSSNGYKNISKTRYRNISPEGYDLIFANILAKPLMTMSSDLALNLKHGGVAILSGLLERQERMVLYAHRANGLKLKKRIRINGWNTLILS